MTSWIPGKAFKSGDRVGCQSTGGDMTGIVSPFGSMRTHSGPDASEQVEIIWPPHTLQADDEWWDVELVNLISRKQIQRSPK